MPGPLELGELKAKQFREQVNRFRETIGTPAPEVEFFHSWPKHEHLDRDQLRWFLYWRTLWETGQVVKTSLSYMMIHIYELLSLEYIQEPEKAVQRLIQFYTEFRNIQPRLDVTVVRWIGDLYLKMGDVENALYWYTHGPNGDLYEKLSWYRFGDMNIPYSFLLKVAAPMQKTQFYRDGMPEIEQTLEEMMHTVFHSFYMLEGEHALDRFARYTDDPTIYLFSSTPIHEKIYLDGFRRYEESGAFVHFVKNCLRYGENLLRRAAGKSKLKCDESVGKYFQELEARYPAPAPAEKKEKRQKESPREVPVLSREMPEEPVEIDFSRIRTLTEETEWLVDMMQESDGAEDLLLVEEDGEAADAQDVSRTIGTERAEVDANYLGALFAGSDAGELEAFLDELRPGEQELLRHLVNTGRQERRVLAEWLKSKRMFLDATMLGINEGAMDQGLEPIVEEDEDEVYLSEEYEAAIGGWALKEEMDR